MTNTVSAERSKITPGNADLNFDLVIKGGTIVTGYGTFQTDIGVRGERTALIGDIASGKAETVIDARGLTVLPGVIDTQVHFREPGNIHKEDLESGSKSAVLGGVTAVFEMPNTDPSTTTALSVEDKLNRAKGRMWCDHAFYVGATAENANNLGTLEALPGCCGVKIFMGSSTGGLLVSDDDTLLQALQSGFRRVAVHSEDEDRLNARLGHRKQGEVASHADWRDSQTALLATKRLINLARKAGRRVHVLHITTRQEIEFLSHNKDIASFEITPQHLTLTAPDCYEKIGSHAQMNPPIRGRSHQQALWSAVKNGLVDVLGSDHAPHTLEEKRQSYPNSPSGMPGVQTLLPLMLDHVAKGRLSIERLVDLTSAGPARLFGLRDKGRLGVGWHADFSLVDLKKSWTITNDWSKSRCGWTPFEGLCVTGYPVATIIRGKPVMRDGDLVRAPDGVPIRFHDTIRS